MNEASTFIEEYFIDVNVCDAIIDNFNKLPEEKKYRGVVGNYTESLKTKTDGDKLDYDSKVSTDTAFDQLDENIQLLYFNELEKCLDQYKEKYDRCTHTWSWRIIERFNIQHYKPGEAFFGWHTENNGDPGRAIHRHLVFMTYLNTVTDGGGTEFMYQNMTTTAVKGKTLIWPSQWTHTHRGVVSPTQEKYIVTGWYSFDE